MSILPDLKERFRQALAGRVEDPDPLLDMVRRSQDAKFGDYQANFAMSLGKQLGRPPREVAAEIVSRLAVSDFCAPPEVAGPGFINLRIKDQWLTERLTAALADPRLGVPRVARPRMFVIDYSAPNVAKPMHVGHIRSTVIGDALYRMLRFLGHTVIGDNHIGDWGAQFGMILYGYKHFLETEAYRRNPVAELARLYRLVRRLVDFQQKGEPLPEAEQSLAAAHADIAAAVLAETAALHAGHAENRRLWRQFLPVCLEDIHRIYRRLDVHFDETLGESFYEDQLAGTVDELLRRGIATPSDGAVCVFIEGQPAPMIVRKQDGAFLYATTDLATIRYRTERWHPDAILYVVDHRQKLHFELLFATAARLGYEKLELTHVSFGTVLGEDGRPFRTRAGDTVGLEGLLDEAVRRAAQIVSANDDAKPDGPELSAAERAQVAETVGIAALKYADLSQNRSSDYVFSYDKMLAMNGNTATYMQYAYARVRSIFARGQVDVPRLRSSGSAILLGCGAERALGLEVLRFTEALELAAAEYRPNQLTSYLFELANRYFTFYEQCPVLSAPSPELRQSRLLLCDLTARTIRKGLELLGIRVVEKM
ncbi:MAG: arginine--tRNA ligase [Thermoguttaceae bacterium]|jgi:arginyl-tRNA synthetase